MMTDAIDLETMFPALLRPVTWGGVTMHSFRLADRFPPADLVQSVNLVPFVGNRCVVIGFEDGGVTLPGGTREIDEPLVETVRREVLEETGAVMTSCVPFGFWECHSADMRPWRTHLPHPDFLRVVCYGDVVMSGTPTNPADAEQIDQVELLDVDPAVRRLQDAGRSELADVYLLAAFLRAHARGS